MALPMTTIDTFAGQNWLITPAALALHEVPPRNIYAQKWLLTLSGVATVTIQGNSEPQWLQETLILQPSVVDPLHSAIATYAIPQPSGTEGIDYGVLFQVEQWAPYASFIAVFNQGQSHDVEVWRPNHFGTGTESFSNQPVDHLFTGLQVDIAVLATDTSPYRIGYTMTLLGKIVFCGAPG